MEIAHGYNIEVLNNATKSWQFLAIATENSYVISNPSQLPGYHIRVSAFVRNNGISLVGNASNIIMLEIINKPDLFFTDNSANSVTLSWTPIADTTYVLEKYDFDTNKWNILKETADEQYTDKAVAEAGEPNKSISGLYRVYAKKGDSRGSSSNEVIAYSEGISVTQDGAAQTITWPAVEGAYKYRISIKDSYGDRGFPSSIIPIEKTNTATLSLTPDSVQALMIHAYAEDGSYIQCVVDELIIKTEKLKMLDKNHVHYDHSINAQLLYLVDAINKTKHETGTVTVSANSAVSYKTDKFFINDYSDSTINAILSYISDKSGINKDTDDIKDIIFNGTEISKETLTFENCIAKNTEGKSVNLSKYIDPSNEEAAYLYNSTNPSAWKEGVKSLTVTSTANGGYKYVMVLHKEEYGIETNISEAYYHNGFATTVASMGQFTSTDLQNEISSVGDTTITAVINANGTLDSYQVVSPYSMKMKQTVNGFGIIKSFGMLVSGNLASVYTFSR